jgi:hypothetical protein
MPKPAPNRENLLSFSKTAGYEIKIFIIAV